MKLKKAGRKPSKVKSELRDVRKTTYLNEKEDKDFEKIRSTSDRTESEVLRKLILLGMKHCGGKV